MEGRKKDVDGGDGKTQVDVCHASCCKPLQIRGWVFSIITQALVFCTVINVSELVISGSSSGVLPYLYLGEMPKCILKKTKNLSTKALFKKMLDDTLWIPSVIIC